MRQAIFHVFVFGCIHCSFAQEQAIQRLYPYLEDVEANDMKEALQRLEIEIVLDKRLAAAKFEEIDGLLAKTPSEERKTLLTQKIEEIHSLAKRIDALNESKKEKINAIKTHNPPLQDKELLQMVSSLGKEECSCFSAECNQRISEKLSDAILAQTTPGASQSIDRLQAVIDQEDAYELKESLQLLELQIVLEKTLAVGKFEEMDSLLLDAPSKERESLLAEKIEEIQSLAKKVDVLNEEKKEKLGSLNAIAPIAEDGFYYFSSHCEHRIAAKLKAAALAQANSAPKPSFQPDSTPDMDTACGVCDQPCRIDIRHIEGGGIGYNQGYSTLDGYFSLSRGDFIPFIDVRGHVFNDGKWAGNAGIGLRYLLDPLKTMIGGNLYYDYRKTNHYHYNQAGAGLEAFYSRWEFYINGYLPFGKKRKGIDHTFDGLTFNSFFENSILMDQNFTDTREFAMRGFDAEIGAHCLNACNRDLYVGAGPYYFNADGSKTTWGGKIRIKAKITKYFSLEVIDSFDHLFHNRLQGSIALSFPIGKQKSPNRSLSKNLLCKIAQESPQRQEIIVVNKAEKSFKRGPVVAVDPATGQPYFVVFIDNTNTNTLPNGTFENPFPTAMGAQMNSVAGNVIYTFPGDGTTKGMDLGITLKSEQRFLGSGVSHLFNTTLGALTIPPQTLSSPHISHPGANVIELGSANGVEVSGFNIALSNTNLANGIHSNSTTGLTTITRNTITGEATGVLPQNDGMRLEFVFGDVFIDNNTIINTARNSIFVQKGGADSGNLFTISNNVMVAPFENALFVQNASGANRILNLIISGNQVTNSAQGFLTFNSNAPIYGTFSRNIFSNNAAHGITVTPNTAPVALQFINNHMDNNGSNGVLIQPTGTGSACVQFIDNVATGNALTDYNLDGSTSPVREEPPSGNVGNFSRTDVTSVSEGFCPF